MSRHGKLESGSSDLFLVSDGYGGKQVWTSDEKDAAEDVLAHLQDVVAKLQEAYDSLPDGFDTSFLDGVMGDVEDISSWYDEAVHSAEEI